MARFEIAELPLAGLRSVTRTCIGDDRGFLSRLFCANELAPIGFDRPIVQINHTLTRAPGTVRGMHFQYPPAAEDKLVTCLRGEVFDVAVDLRPDSPTFLAWHGLNLSASNRTALFIPRGFAHGFQTLSSDAELLYLHTHEYVQGSEGGLNPLDPTLAIAWPLPVTALSDRDSRHAFITEKFAGVTL